MTQPATGNVWFYEMASDGYSLDDSCSTMAARTSDRRAELEASFGDELDWRRMDGKKVSMVVCKTPVRGYSKENWNEMIGWLFGHYRKMKNAFSEPVQELAARKKAGGGV